MFKQNTGDEPNMTVSKEDQLQIATFSKLNQSLHEKQYQLKQRKEMLEQMDDAATEMELMDEEEVTAIKYGDCFFR